VAPVEAERKWRGCGGRLAGSAKHSGSMREENAAETHFETWKCVEIKFN
jgi:hypothetical protein